jgi:hypothetical protein
MHGRLVMIAAAALVASGAFAAEPARDSANSNSEPQRPTAPIVLASAETVQQPGTAEQHSPTPPKRRIARVTKCRCGAQQGSAEQ